MAGYIATFSNGHTATIKNTKRVCGAAWCYSTDKGHTYTGFSRDRAAALKTMESDSRLTPPEMGAITFREVVDALAACPQARA